MKSLYIYLVISLSILPLTSSISFSFEQQKTKQCFSRTIHANNEIALQFQIIGSSQLKIQTTLTQNNQQTFKTIKNHYSELDSIKKPKKLSIDHTCTLCFEVINRGSLSSMTPSIAFHFSQSNPEDSMQTDYIHSQQIMRTIQKLKGTHHRLLNSLLDVQLSLENEQYQQQVYLEVEQQVKRFSYAKILVAFIIFAVQLWILIRLFSSNLKLPENDIV